MNNELNRLKNEFDEYISPNPVFTNEDKIRIRKKIDQTKINRVSPSFIPNLLTVALVLIGVFFVGNFFINEVNFSQNDAAMPEQSSAPDELPMSDHVENEASEEAKEAIGESEGALEVNEGVGTTFDYNTYEVIDGEVANYFSYNFQDRTMYIAGLKGFEEFDNANEGTVSISSDGNVLTFSMTKATGSITGAVDGPNVYFQINLNTNEITMKRFTPAPNYEELGKEEFAEYSNEVIDLSDERLVEIGLYFIDLINEIEAL
ncbi:MAG: hypothetical protein ACK4M9_07300 [Anaerobacillus sp.]|uniref:hypothetical protein n=1 Tax=Anaerobacillus sp. TaxID=1872506 RepID=UPI00391911AB